MARAAIFRTVFTDADTHSVDRNIPNCFQRVRIFPDMRIRKAAIPRLRI